MTSTGNSSVNLAGGSASVGIQVQSIDLDGDLIVVEGVSLTAFAGDPPEDKYRIGLNNLNSGKATKARELIWDAITGGYTTSEARFHWLVAMLSGRTVRQFSDEELNQLNMTRGQSPRDAGDPWSEGAWLVFRLLESAGVLKTEGPRPDTSAIVGEFDRLGANQHALLLRHLDLFLEGQLKDDVWRRERENAEAGQSGGDRRNRAWKFFQPVPIDPRVRPVQPLSTTLVDRFAAWISAGFFAAVAGYFGWDLLRHGAVLGMLGYMAGLVGAAVAAVNGLELRYLAERRRMKDSQLQAPAAVTPRSPGERFAGKVDALFRRYAPKYLPDKAERDAWEAATAGIRSFDRDEIVEVYRESRIPAERVAWLVRYRIRQSRDRWRKGELYDYQNDLLPEPGTLGKTGIGIAIAIVGVVVAIVMLRASPLTDAVCVITGVLSGAVAWRTRLRIALEDRRHAADVADSAQRQAEIQVEFERWKDRLKDRPSDAEVQAWLDNDRTVLLAQAMDHYKRARHQVVTYAFLEEPAKRAKHARLRNGPVRYSRYKLIVFVLTADGVRQMSADLGFTAVTLHLGDRISYRYNAVASAHVSLIRSGPPMPRIQQTFTLTLVNGDPISVVVMDLRPGDIRPGEDEDSLSEAAFDAASVANTLHVLEGIAAEGKRWVRERERLDEGRRLVTAAGAGPGGRRSGALARFWTGRRACGRRG
jgi:hypothetical protein